jgi:hypothetical protein
MTREEHRRLLWRAAVTIEETMAVSDNTEKLMEQARELSQVLEELSRDRPYEGMCDSFRKPS